MTVSPPCPTCHSPTTEILATSHRNDPLCYCLACKHFWRPSTLDDGDSAREHEERRRNEGAAMLPAPINTVAAPTSTPDFAPRMQS
jgi:hypothetical protein